MQSQQITYEQHKNQEEIRLLQSQNSSDKNLEMTRPSEKDKTQNETILKHYRKSEQVKWFFGSQTFDLRFDEIKNSFSDQSSFKTMWMLLKWKLSHTKAGLPKDLKIVDRSLPMTKPNFSNTQHDIKYTWIGHSTAVISFGKDANFIIDPVFSQRCSPYQFIGPKRFRPPACQINQLPRIDAVIVSHDHYDHLDGHSLQRIWYRFPQANFMAGLASSDVFPKKCFMHEFDWTETKQIDINGQKFKITFVPVCHWGQRGLFDKNKRLWGGFIIQSPTKQKVFYSGDTGYTGIFAELGQIFGPFDLCILPIGAYQPRDFLKNQHIDPIQAVKIHKQLKSKKSVGVHWGTFPLGYQLYDQARQDLETAKKNQGLKDDEFLAIGHGASFTIDYK